MADWTDEFKGWIADLKGLTARVLFPAICPGCRRLVSSPGTLCAKCWPTLRFIERPWCEVLGTPFSHDMGEGILCADAIANPPPFARARSVAAYSGVTRQIVHNLKFTDRTELAPWMARWMMRTGSELIADAQVIVPVPLHRRRFVWRRFNQSAELARAISRLSGKSFAPEAIVRIKATRNQVGLSAREREENVRDAFRVPEAHEIAVRGRRVLLVDDVYTTGMTVYAVTRALRQGGAQAVDVLTFAHVLPGDFQPDDHLTI